MQVFNDIRTDFDYATYSDVQYHSISESHIIKKCGELKVSDKYTFQNNTVLIKPYLGYAVVSMLMEQQKNENVLHAIRKINNQLNLLQNTVQPYLYFLPEDSYHQTIANTLSASRYTENILAKGLENEYPQIISEILKPIKLSQSNEIIHMKMIGLNAFGSCLALLGVFETEHDYSKIVSFRNQFYESDTAKKHNIKWTRPFIGHITIAYLANDIETTSRNALSKAIIDINKQVDWTPLIFSIRKAELRKFENLSSFIKSEHFPEFTF